MKRKCVYYGCRKKGVIYLNSVKCWYCKEHFEEIKKIFAENNLKKFKSEKRL